MTLLWTYQIFPTEHCSGELVNEQTGEVIKRWTSHTPMRKVFHEVVHAVDSYGAKVLHIVGHVTPGNPQYTCLEGESLAFLVSSPDTVYERVLAIQHVVYERPPQAVDKGITILLSGTSMRAEVFGDTLWVPCRNGRIESFTGQWEPAPYATNHAWVGFEVEVVLAKPLYRYYFPRLWNPHGPWITKTELTNKLHEWHLAKKEFLACSPQI